MKQGEKSPFGSEWRQRVAQKTIPPAVQYPQNARRTGHPKRGGIGE
jgi:hypothetical protein